MKTQENDCDNSKMMPSSKRDFIKKAGSTAALITGLAACANAGNTSSHAHHHSAKTTAAVSTSVSTAKKQAVIHEALNSVAKGELCNQHCIDLFKAGDTSVAECADKVQEMVAMCTALAKMAAHDSAFLKPLMRVSIDVCHACQKECEKHVSHHAPCKECAQACVSCIKACEAYLA